MRASRWLAVYLALLAGTAVAQEIPLASLGNLELRYQEIREVALYPGRDLPAQAGFRPGEAFAIIAPDTIQQVRFLVATGELVGVGTPIAVLRGPEVHHFLAEFEASKQLLVASERRYKNNRPLYERKAIRESQWIEVSEKYYAAQLRYEHMRHFYELVVATDEAIDAITISAPIAGIVDYSPEADGIAAGENIALLIPPDAVRLQAEIPVSLRTRLAALRAGQCELQVAQIAGVSHGFFVSAWTEPLTADCYLLPGQKLRVSPMLRGPALQVNRAAVFRWQGEPSLLLRSGQSLAVVAVEILGSRGSEYFLRSGDSLRGGEALVSSVSALQGILLGLGGE